MGGKIIAVKLSGKFKKDLKRYQYRIDMVTALGEVIKYLKKMDGYLWSTAPTNCTVSMRDAWNVIFRATSC